TAAAGVVCYRAMVRECFTELMIAQWVVAVAVLSLVLFYWSRFTSKMPCFFPIGATSLAGGTIGALIGTHMANGGFHLTGTPGENLRLCILVFTFCGTFLGRAIGELFIYLPRGKRTLECA